MGFAVDIIEYLLRNPVIFISLFLAYFLVVGLYFYFTPKEVVAPNPFRSDARKSPQDLITDKTHRDGVLKQGNFLHI